MTTTSRSPRISVGMPAYNGARYLRHAVESHLSQTFADFELIIADDASTDGTQAICEELAARDPRIRYVRLADNGGATRNFNRVFELARGEFFKWSAQDDLIEPTFLESCLNRLEARPEAVLCHTRCRIVDLTPLERGEKVWSELPVLEKYDPARFGTDADRPSARFGGRIKGWRCTELYGLVRRDALGRVNREGRPPRGPEQESSTAPFQPFVGADRAVLAELAIEGKFACVPDELFYNGAHPGRGSAQGRSPLERLAFYRPIKEGSKSFPISSLFKAYLDMVDRRIPSRGQRLVCYWHMFGALFRRFNILRLLFEFLNAVDPRLGRAMVRAYQAVRRVRPPSSVGARSQQGVGQG